MLTDDRLSHPLKAAYPSSVTLSGIVTEERLSQSLNAEYSILVTPSGIMTEVMLLQKLNALSPITVTLSGITTSSAVPLYFFNTPSSMINPSGIPVSSFLIRASARTGISAFGCQQYSIHFLFPHLFVF